MKQTNEKQICQQIDCKRFITHNQNNQQILRCFNCYSILKSNQLQQIKQKKQELIQKKLLLQQQIDQLYADNQQLWQEGVIAVVNQSQLFIMKEKQFKLENTVRICKRNLLTLREKVQQNEQQIKDLNTKSQFIQTNYYDIKQQTKKKQLEIQNKESIIQKIRYIQFAQLPFLLDNHQPYKNFSINEELKETTYEDFLILSSIILDKTSCFSKYNKKKELCLTLKKGIDKWGEFFQDHLDYYENFILSFIGVYKMVYYLANILNITLPYSIYIDNQNFPQFWDYKIFQKNKKSQMIEFKDSSLNQLQINIYYLKYQLNADISDKLYSFFDIIDLLNTIYRTQQFQEFQQLDHLIKNYIKKDFELITKNKIKHVPIPIKLASIQCSKFQKQQQKIVQPEEDEFDDVEILIIQ